MPKEEQRTKPAALAEGRGHKLARESAQAIADASTAAGFPVPPQAAAALARPAASQPAPQAPAAPSAPKSEA